MYGDKSSLGINAIKTILEYNGTNDEILTQFENNLQKEYNKMAKSVIKYNGFYVGRYETSLNTEGNAQSKKNETPLCEVTWYDFF